MDVSEEARYVTCLFCASKLAIQHSESAIYTTVSAPKETIQELSENIKMLQLQRDIDQLDREWQQAHESYVVNTRSGPKPPSIDESLFGVGMAVVGIVFVAGAIALGNWPFLLDGLLIPAGIFTAKGAYDYAEDYQSVKGRYRGEVGREIQLSCHCIEVRVSLAQVLNTLNTQP